MSKIEIPGAVREHVAAGLKAKYPRTRLIAIYDVAVYVCQDSPGNVPVEQEATPFSPKMSFFLADSASVVAATNQQ